MLYRAPLLFAIPSHTCRPYSYATPGHAIEPNMRL